MGTVAAGAAVVWLSTRPNLATESRALRSASPPPVESPEIYNPPEKIQTPVVEQKTAQTGQNTMFHVVQKGDTLSAISQKYYGTPRYWQKILAANDKILKDPDRLVPGTRLLIPE